MKNVIIIPNMLRDTDGTGTKSIIEFLKSRNINVYIDKSLEAHNFDAIYSDINTITDIDMVIIMGGDGTILSESKNYINTEIPILGINYGNVGFLTELEKNDMKGLEDIINGNYSLEKRPIIKVNHRGQTYYSINEVAIHRGSSPKMLDIDIIIENVPMNEFRADGLIVATSSGSTAYSLSAGGPIIDPLVNAFVVTPVCPQNVYIKSVVVSADTEINVKLKDSEQCTFSIDGNLIDQIKGNHEIVIKKGGYINTVKRTENSFYKKLRKKIFEKEI
ncbi:MAG: NAD(+)/NADH kinase [Clostridia bacterium]|nr:NAD(+)/NADH kinase [Clostridia bacterium]